MTKEQLKNFFKAQLTNGDIFIVVSTGKTKYSNTRAEVKVKDTANNKARLDYKRVKNGNEYIFTDGLVEAELQLIEAENTLTFNVKCPEQYNRFIIKFKSFKDEMIFGCGKEYMEYNLKGKTIQAWVNEREADSKIAKGIVKAKQKKEAEPIGSSDIGSLTTQFSSYGFTSSKKYFVKCNASSFGEIAFNEEELIYNLRCVPESFEFVFGEDHLELAQNITSVTGKQPPLPKFASNGAIISVQGGTKKLNENFTFLSELGCKLSAIVIEDWSGRFVNKNGVEINWNWQLDERLYSDFKKVLMKLREAKVRVLGYVNPYLKDHSPQYSYALNHDYLVKQGNGKVYMFKTEYTSAAIIDITNPKAYDWFKKLLKEKLIDEGFNGWVADYGENLPCDLMLNKGPSEEFHNEYAILWNKLHREVIKEIDKEADYLVLFRSAFNNSFTYTNAMSSGVNACDFSREFGLGSVIPALLSMSATGVGLSYTDVSGYTNADYFKRDVELFRRWCELAIFLPILKTTEGENVLENISYHSQDTYEAFVKYLKIFELLKPYRRYVIEEYNTKGIPYIRPMYYHYNEADCYKINDQFMVGSELVIAPILKPGEKTRNVYLPPARWINLFTGKAYYGGVFEITAPVGRPIAFYKDETSNQQFFEKFKGLHNNI